MQKIAQIVLPVYGLLLIFGGFKGYQAGSNDSLYTGAGSGVVALLLSLLSTRMPRLALALGAGVAALLTGLMGWRFEKTGRMMPAGMIAMTSLVTTGIQAMGAIKSR